MKQIIEDLWNGNIAVGETCGVHNPEVKELIQLMLRNKEALQKELDKNQKAILEKYIDASQEYVFLLAEQAFCDGFCLACRLMAEALT